MASQERRYLSVDHDTACDRPRRRDEFPFRYLLESPRIREPCMSNTEHLTQRDDASGDSFDAARAWPETDGRRQATGDRVKELYIPTLDGVRAVAFGIVLLSHTPGIVVVPGGLGVTIFFFLSGFLIATLMRREFDRTGQFLSATFMADGCCAFSLRCI